MFSGQGSQYFQMGRELYEQNQVFREWATRLDALAQEVSGVPVLDALYSGSRSAVFDRTALTHPAIFIVEIALAHALIDAGLRPDAMLGASLGSFAAAAMAGLLDVEEALVAVTRQAEVLESHCERGGMIAVLADPALFAEGFLARHAELAANNFATHFAVSAPQADLEPIEAELRARGITSQRLAVSFAFHSRWIDAARAPYEPELRSLRRTAGRLPLVCCDRAASVGMLPEDFAWRWVRDPIRFADTVRALEREGPWRYVDAGPAGTLATFVKYGLPRDSKSTTHAVLTPFGQDLKNLAALRTSVSG